MSQYIKSEIYRILRAKWTYLFIIICSGLLLSSNIVLALVKNSDSTFGFATTKFAFGTFSTSMTAVYLLCITVASILFGNENTNHTLKNAVSFGISRGTIYIGKFLVQIIYSLVAFTIITVVYVGSGYLLLENSGIEVLLLLLRTSLICVPFFLFALAATNCFQFIFESSGGTVAAITGLLFILPMVADLLGMRFKIFAEFSKLIPWTLINQMKLDFDKYSIQLLWDGAAGYRNYWLIGIIETLLITAIGYVVFSKKEIK